VGEDVYKRLLPIVRGHAQLKGAVLLDEGETKAVVQYLAKLKDAKSGGAVNLTVGLSRVQKFVSNGKRTIRGLANSGQLDRVGDIVDPKGGSWTLPVPLLWQHQHDQPIGWVRSIDARNDGLWITAELAEGIGKSDEAWRAIEAGLVDSYSIGFKAYDWEPLSHGGKRFTSWTLLEISVVTVPADPAAKIRRGVSSIDRAIQVAKGS
jgi:HK97 family phage prohead protease